MSSIQDYEALVNRLTQEATNRPMFYRLKVFLLALLGFSYVLMLFTIALSLGIGVFIAAALSKNALVIKLVFKLFWFPLTLAYLILKSMLIRIPAPEGRPLKSTEFPSLFAEIEYLRKQAGAKKVHRVVLTDELNAAVASVPRLGLLGWNKNYLILGLPLMATLSREQFRSVLAHEFGHLSKNHNRFSNWIYRLRMTWHRLLSALEQRDSIAVRLFSPFFNWYIPYFNAYSFVLARSNEYEADAVAGQVTSPATAAEALLNIEVRSTMLEQRYWGELFGLCRQKATPPGNAVTNFVSAAKQTECSEADLQDELNRSLAETTGLNDTHPSLTERIHALGVEPHIPAAIQDSAADHFFGDALVRLTGDQDQAWCESVAGEWKTRHEYVANAQTTFDTLSQKRETGDLDINELYHFAEATETLYDADSAHGCYGAVLERDPDHADANFCYGHYLLDTGNDAGISFIERAMRQDESIREDGAKLLYRYFAQENDKEQADTYLAILDQIDQQRSLARCEREHISKKDRFEPHGLFPEAIDAWRQALKHQPKVKKAWLARKSLTHYPESFCFVVIVKLGGFVLNKSKTLQQIVDAVPSEHHVMVFHASDVRGLTRKITKVADANVYTK